MSVTFVHALALGLDPAWRRRPPAERAADGRAFVAALDAVPEVRTVPYSMIGLQAGIDLLLWRTGPALDRLEEAAAAILRSSFGGWLVVRESFLGRTGSSQYVARPSPQEQAILEGERLRYLIAYPFTKSTDWYLMSREARQGVMNEHIRVGRAFPQVRQLLAYSFGLDDPDFLVAYETDDLVAFGDLVHALRATEARRSTVRDTPILAAVQRPIDEILGLLGAAPEAEGEMRRTGRSTATVPEAPAVTAAAEPRRGAPAEVGR
jgi:chlorite dismutase